MWKLNQKQLKHILFPIGDFTKIQVRALAKKFKLPVLDISESQEICFVPNSLNDFLTQYVKLKPGLILTTEGKKIGQHKGLPFYTIGQRKGIELSGGPFYVVDKDLRHNVLIVAHFYNHKSLYSKSLIARNVNWIFGKEPKLPFKLYPRAKIFGVGVKAQIRYGHKAVQAVIAKKSLPKKLKLIFVKPQRAVTPGQSVVFYHNQELLGGGIIC